MQNRNITTSSRLEVLYNLSQRAQHIAEEKLKEEMEEFYIYLQQLIYIDQLVIPSKDFDLVLDLNVTEDQRISWSYYYACHETRCLFWLETYDASYMISELNGVKSPAHVSALQLPHSSLPWFQLML